MLAPKATSAQACGNRTLARAILWPSPRRGIAEPSKLRQHGLHMRGTPDTPTEDAVSRIRPRAPVGHHRPWRSRRLDDGSVMPPFERGEAASLRGMWRWWHRVMKRPEQGESEGSRLLGLLPPSAAIAGWLAAGAMALLTVRHGYPWLAPMAACLALGMLPLWVRGVVLRRQLRSALAELPDRSYRLPLGSTDTTPLAGVASELLGPVTSFCIVRAGAAVGAADRAALAGRWRLSPGMLRVAYAGLPVEPCLPAVFLLTQRVTVALAKVGPGRLIRAVAHQCLGPPEHGAAAEAYRACMEMIEYVDSQRRCDLQRLGGLSAVAAGVVGGLVDAGCRPVVRVPLAAAGDFLALARLAFAWPPGSQLGIEQIELDAAVPGGRASCLSIVGRGSKASDGRPELDVVLIRTADDMLQCFERPSGSAGLHASHSQNLS